MPSQIPVFVPAPIRVPEPSYAPGDAPTYVRTPLMRPEYSNLFRCIGPACEDSCCAGWTVTFDKSACEKYEALPEGPLRVLVDANVIRQPLKADGTAAHPFAKVRLDGENACPFLNSEKLCEIQMQHGEGYLSKTCATYPRIEYVIDGLEEKALCLSCPEAARLVLMTENLLEVRGERSYQITWQVEDVGSESGEDSARDVRGHFWPVREFVLRLLSNREYALWQRLFLVGIFVRELGNLSLRPGGFGGLLGGFREAVEEGSFRRSMEVIPADLGLQLDMVLQLAGMKLPRTFVGARFLETLARFTEGIGNAPGVAMKELIRGYSRAQRRHYEPFFEAHPQMLENLLINLVFKNLFPYGPKVANADWAPALEYQFSLIALQFALIKGLLIGVAGARGRDFSVDDVVFTVQSASKHFEHHPAFLVQAHGLLVSTGNDHLRGLTMLLRN